MKPIRVLSSHSVARHTMTLRYPEVPNNLCTWGKAVDLIPCFLRRNPRRKRGRLSIRTFTSFQDSIRAESVQRNSRCCLRNSPHRHLLGGLLLYGILDALSLVPKELIRDSSRLCTVHNAVNERLKKVKFFARVPSLSHSEVRVIARV